MAKKLPPRAVPPKPMTAEERAFVEEVKALRPQGTKPVSQGTEAPKGRNLVPRAGGKAMRRIAAYFTPELAKRIELHCVEHDCDLSDVIVTAVEQYLKPSGH